MRTDESGAPWPYATVDAGEVEGAPAWMCPEETCTCSEHQPSAETYEFSVMLCAPDGERMPGARCRILANGKLANTDMPYADGEGWVTAVVTRVPETVLVEWAPAELPDSPRLPYRRRYYVNLREDSERESTRRRLHNLGFSYFPTLRENIKDFQCEYGEVITGEIADVAEKLRLYHDAAMVPITSVERPRPAVPSRSAPQQGIVFAAFGPMADSNGASGGGGTAPSPPSPPQGSGATKAGTGTVKLSISPEIYPKSIVELVDKGEAVYQWRQLVVTNKDMSMVGHFWIFTDALKDKKTGRRWPCSAAESQIVARKIRTTPNMLPGWVDPPVEHVPGKDGSKRDPAESLLLTPLLMDLRWAKAFAQGHAIRPYNQNVAGLLAVENEKMSKAVDADLAKLKGVEWVADPGKIWALSNRLGEGKKSPGSKAINYGWHWDPKLAKPHQAVTSGQFVGQPVGGVHDAYHIDYSQILLLLAGWCLVGTKDAVVAMMTKDVLTSTKSTPTVPPGGRSEREQVENDSPRPRKEHSPGAGPGMRRLVAAQPAGGQRAWPDDARARGAVMAYEEQHGRKPDAKPFNNEGYDIESHDPVTGRTRRIEVKGTWGIWEGDASVILSARQFRDPQLAEARVEHWLYVVDSSSVIPIPWASRGIDGYVFYARDWVDLAVEPAPIAVAGAGVAREPEDTTPPRGTPPTEL